jgi:hypothetical protein
MDMEGMLGPVTLLLPKTVDRIALFNSSARLIDERQGMDDQPLWNS